MSESLMRKLATRALWEGADVATLTVGIVGRSIGLASRAIAAARKLEERGAWSTRRNPLFAGVSISEEDDGDTGPLFKTTIVIWSEASGEEVELEDLAREATSGDAYCSRQQTLWILDPRSDPAWDGTEFFSRSGD